MSKYKSQFDNSYLLNVITIIKAIYFFPFPGLQIANNQVTECFARLTSPCPQYTLAD